MAKRRGAAVLAGGVLLALLSQGSAAAQETEVSGGYVSWTLDTGELTLGGSTAPAWFPAAGGSADPETGAADLELGGTAQLVPSVGTAPPLILAGLRLRLDGDSGALHARTAVEGQARELALAEVKPGASVVRAGGVTWTGLEASLTDEGAELLSRHSGSAFAEGDGLGRLAVTVGTGGEPARATPPPPPPPPPPPLEPTATVAAPALSADSEQTVVGEGFEPGEVLLVSIDQDTRYQVTADRAGRVSRTFPVYATAAAGEHTVELRGVSGERDATARFTVHAPMSLENKGH
ncbi:HtaA domain-containing protein [Streptomyces sp. TRM68416]|uniref:HtaA domain-containing protein n=1 Tax=Streptomyces sp. TRM68416 TaxID=2758412 RepID=UPI001661E265|nr:HtaA domain-containing protein [Streptomyces sp. TRM68416]MBD0841650.1 HtaA domain-containing protein [Streptomyces sp. TRM68416]